jgi:hypothetical protein
MGRVYVFTILSFLNIKKFASKLGAVAYICNLIHSGGRDLGDYSLRASQTQN